MKIAFVTYVSDQYFHSFGADKLLASAKYFHPEIPFFVFGTKDIEGIGLPLESLHPFIMNKVKPKFDAVVYFDADSIITGKLDELFEALKTHEVVCVRNNNDFGKAGMSEPITQNNRDINIYVNAGLVATTSQDFISEWISENKKFAELLPFGSQSVLNSIVDNYHWTIVDTVVPEINPNLKFSPIIKRTNVYYGVSGLYGENSHWDSWKEIQVIEGELILNGKKVKVLHHAGGFQPYKLGLHLFNEEARKRLEEIIYGNAQVHS